jgi:DNA-binding response OmpR family regulator
MLHIILVTLRREIFHSFVECLSSDPEVCLEQVTSGAEALGIVRTESPHLVIVDSEVPDTDPLGLVREMISANAMVNTAVVSALSDREFHEAAEGFGILCRLPLDPGPGETEGLLKKLRSVLMYAASSI